MRLLIAAAILMGQSSAIVGPYASGQFKTTDGMTHDFPRCDPGEWPWTETTETDSGFTSWCYQPDTRVKRLIERKD